MQITSVEATERNHKKIAQRLKLISVTDIAVEHDPVEFNSFSHGFS